jgi:uncharacterized membrane protein YraQ (UPF0718 family)
MSIDTYIIYGLALAVLIVSFVLDKKKTMKGIKKGAISLLKILRILVPLIFIIGILMVIINPDVITSALGEGSGILGYLFAFVVGSITFLPAFISYPLGAELIEAGAGVPQVAGFLVTVMSVGVVYISAEIKYFSKKATLYRNLISLIGAVLVVLIVWVVF